MASAGKHDRFFRTAIDRIKIDKLKVFHSLARPSETANPYVTKLLQSTAPDIDHLFFSYWSALFYGYDVFHAQWPEYLIRGAGRIRTFAKQFLFILLLTRLQIFRLPIVQTIHNIEPHEKSTRWEFYLLRRLDELTTHWIRLNPETATRTPVTKDIPIGHYLDWNAKFEIPRSIPGRILFFGLIRRYKGIEDLLSAFFALEAPDVSLRIVGKANSEELRSLVTKACADDSRISAELEYIDNASLAYEIGSASLVVLPYQNMFNSSALIHALSLGRRVLVPATLATTHIAREVGSEWVQLYAGALSAEVLLNAVRNARTLTTSPNLSGRDWDVIAAQHVELYKAAVSQCRSLRSKNKLYGR